MSSVIVIGLGAMGSATALQLASRGHRVVGLDCFQPPHTHGSSHGRTRIIRRAYFEDSRYVPLLARAYELWRSLQADSGVPLLHIIGGLMIGRPTSDLVEARPAQSASRFRTSCSQPPNYVADIQPSASIMTGSPSGNETPAISFQRYALSSSSVSLLLPGLICTSTSRQSYGRRVPGAVSRFAPDELHTVRTAS
jgi:hypothetical protein